MIDLEAKSLRLLSSNEGDFKKILLHFEITTTELVDQWIFEIPLLSDQTPEEDRNALAFDRDEGGLVHCKVPSFDNCSLLLFYSLRVK